jgi:hypothetical protein
MAGKQNRAVKIAATVPRHTMDFSATIHNLVSFCWIMDTAIGLNDVNQVMIAVCGRPEDRLRNLQGLAALIQPSNSKIGRLE